MLGGQQRTPQDVLLEREITALAGDGQKGLRGSHTKGTLVLAGQLITIIHCMRLDEAEPEQVAAYPQDILVGREVELLAGDGEGEGGHAGDARAVDDRLAAAQEGQRVARAVQGADDLLLRLVVGQRDLRPPSGALPLLQHVQNPSSSPLAHPAQPVQTRVMLFVFMQMARPCRRSLARQHPGLQQLLQLKQDPRCSPGT